MKSISPFNILVSISIILLFFLFGTTYSKLNKVEPAGAMQTVSGQNTGNAGDIVFIDTDTLWEKFDMVKDVKSELEKEKSSMEGTFQAKYRALEKEFINFQEVAPKLSPENGQTMQAELMKKEQDLAIYKEELAGKLLEKEQEKNQLVQDAILAYIKKYNADGRFLYVLGKGQGGGILYASDSREITREIIDGLNKDYKLKKAVAK